MEFRRRKAKGRSQQTYKLWVSDCGFFRITWTNEFGFKHYHACVKVEGDRWEFAYRRGPHKTFKKAVESCEKNKRLWDAFVKLSHSTGRRDGKLLELKCRAPAVFFNMPVWVRDQAEPGLIRMLLCPSSSQPHQSDDTEVSKTSESNDFSGACPTTQSSTRDSGPASPVKAKAATGRKKTATLSKDTSSPLGTPAKPAKEPAVASKKRSKRSTTPGSKSSKPASRRGKKQSDSSEAA